MKYILTLFFAGVLFVTLSAQNKNEITMSDFMGINTNVASYDDKYIDDLAQCVKWIREYHSWGHYEVADNYYKWDNITTFPQGYTWPDHNKFMDECQKLGVKVLIDVLGKPDWAGSAPGAFSVGDGTKAKDYLDKLEFMGQLVARYGAQKVENSKLETADKVSGLNYIKYYEDDNEPDYWWESPKWPAENYSIYCNAVHDGFGVETSEDFPLLGIKSVDSTAMHVLGGLAGNSTTYIQKILDASNGRIPFDVINIHTYCNDSKDGYSPENENFGFEKKLGGFMEWCGNELPDLPVWLTEFGWDTYLNGTQYSYVYAPEEQQANYILRSYFVALKMGFEKAFLFMDKDPNSTNTLQYSSSGIISDKGTGMVKKPSFYFLATLQNILGDAVLNEIVSYREPIANNEVFCFQFLNQSSELVYVLWTRTINSKIDNGTTLNYSLDLEYQPEYVSVIRPKDKDYDGEKTDLEINGSELILTLSETPQFVVVAGNKTSSIQSGEKKMDFQVYPNPTKNTTQISFLNPNYQKINISVYSIEGQLIKVVADGFFNPGRQLLNFGKNVSPGVYFLSLNANNSKEIEKVVFQ